nr:mechanosensitive ion channel domain-containing protein [uncultured Deefgea sp.]
MVNEQHNLLATLIQDISEFGVFHPQFLIQAAVLLICWGGAYWFSRSLLRQFQGQTSKWKVGEDGIRRILFPALALILVSAANLILHFIEGRTNSLLQVANLLMLAMVNIRILVYVLRLAFDGSAWVKQSEKYIAASVWCAYVLHVVGILPEVLNILDSLSFNVGAIHISVLTVIQGLLSVCFTLVIAMWAGRLLEQRLMSASMMDMNVRVVLVKVMRSLLVVLAVLASLAMVGIDLTVLSVFGGALGVGLGFGLQKIASNYVSGFIILLDRSVKLGDVIAVDNRQGVISKLTSRYVVLKAPDGTESLVPNETLITSTVVNNSYYERAIWIGLPVQIAYNSDLEMVMELLPTVTEGNDRILRDPAPGVMILAFADNGINLTLGFWLKDPENGQGGLRSDLYLKVWQLFKQHGIEIPYPRRDISILPSPAAVQSVS